MATKGNHKHILSKAVIILLMVFVCLPCSLKRDIKQTFHISVSDVKPEKASVCQTLKTGNSPQKTASFHKPDIKITHFHFNAAPGKTRILQRDAIPLKSASIPASVPIYKIHGQYLI